MEFNIKREVFLECVQKTLGIVEKKTTMPILNNVLIRTMKDRIRIIATDREISLIADYNADIVHDGEITLSARKLYEMIKESQGEKIHFVTNEQNMVTMTCGKAIYKIPGIPSDDFPTVVAEDANIMFSVDSSLLEGFIKKTSFAISTDDTRKNLTGVYFIAGYEDGNCFAKMVATDGHRLSIADAEWSGPSFLSMEKGIIIPRKGLWEIKKLLEGVEGDVSFGVGQGACVLKTDGVFLKVSLIDGEYPDYQRVIPTERGLMLQFDKNQVLHSLRRMSVISSERYSGVIISLQRNLMVLNSMNPDVGEANDEIDVIYSDHDIEMGYNVNYLIDAIEAVDEDAVKMEIGMGMKPAVVTPANNSGYACIVMPLKL